METLTNLRRELRAHASPTKATASAWFFKTGPGQYGEGDQFIGVTVPEQRKVARAYRHLPLADVITLLRSPIHEERLTALILLVLKFEKGDATLREDIYEDYLENTAYINNWDLVDTSAGHIVGAWLEDKDRSVLKQLARSESLWERRIAMIATSHFIGKGDPLDALEIAEILVNDTHDLIQKAVGWMLREIGIRCAVEAEEAFLKKHYRTMPRTALRYAIEKFSPERRKQYLSGTID